MSSDGVHDEKLIVNDPKITANYIVVGWDLIN